MIEIEEGSTNVYADLGRADANEMLVKARLVARISESVKRRRLTVAKVAEILGLPQPKISAMLRGRFREISEDRLMCYLAALQQEQDNGPLTDKQFARLREMVPQGKMKVTKSLL
jgi:predicted XRE-type DNA-binding protein